MGLPKLVKDRKSPRGDAGQRTAASDSIGFDEFERLVGVTKRDLCRETLAAHRKVIRIKGDERAIRNLERIFDAALRISNANGFQAMSMRRLSKEAGLSMGALYAYFSSKDELLTMLQDQGRGIASRILSDRIQAAADPLSKLRTGVRTHLYLTESMHAWFFFSYMEAKNLTGPEREKAVRSELQTEAVFEEILRQGQEQGIFVDKDCRLTASVIKALVQDWYLKRWKYRQRSISVDRYADHILEMVENFVVRRD
ncbi:MAG: TetR/AcrR family transcriptional regulator [Thermodesulfobacteriota bacterium]